MYGVVDAAVVRVAAHPITTDIPPWPQLTGPDAENVAGWRAWLAAVWAIESFAEAVRTASPTLAGRVAAVCGGQELPARQVRRAVVSVMRYLLRATTRATPFGLFAGVATARFGQVTTVRRVQDAKVVTRVDPVWLAQVVARLEACPALLARIEVVVNDSVRERDGRLVVELRPDPGGVAEPAEVSVRLTRAVRIVMRAARSPIRVAAISDLVCAEFPDTSSDAVDGLVRELVAQRILVTGLRAPMTVTDPLGYLLANLCAAGADRVPEIMPLVAELRAIYTEMTGGRRARAASAMAKIAVADRPVHVDMRADLDLVLPQIVIRETVHAARVLTQLTAHPFGHPRWRDYHHRFLERYGPGAAVPVLDLVDPDVGLGYPAGYRGSLFDRPPPLLSDRDVRLLALAQHSALAGEVEVTLDQSAVDELTCGVPVAWRPHTELSFRLHATSREAVDRGEFDLDVVGMFREAGTTIGRFLDVFAAAERTRMAGVFEALPTSTLGAVRAQLSCPPLYTRTEIVSRSRTMLGHILPIGEHRDPHPGLVDLRDLVVIGEPHRFVLWSTNRRRPVEPTALNAVEATNFTHPLQRFLAEVTTSRAATSGPFTWGTAAGGLPFLPRLRHRRTILSPARWVLTAADLPRLDASSGCWADELQRWRQHARVPGTVFVGGGDQRLRLDLTEPAHQALLRDTINRDQRVSLHEAPPADAFGWLDGHAHEIVVPLASTQLPAAPMAEPVHVVRRGDEHLPGSDGWLFAKLYGHPDRHTALLAHLPDLLSTWDAPPSWWFLPYRDPDHHLRLRVRADDPATAARVAAWARHLRERGLISHLCLDTYLPEKARFGTGPAVAAAEAVFAADSAAATSQRHTDSHALTAASLVDIAVSFHGDVEAGMHWLIDNITTDTPVPLPRHQLAHTLHLTHEADALPPSMPARWAERRHALDSYRDSLATIGREPHWALASLLHLHCIRANGINPTAERLSHRLARAAALTWTRRR
ncbi:Lanthionine biosynthesis protein LanB [Alloactinosynnema sp. L-07]|uniref:lantibiotic dehydratase n=1 Tax=Alloactinosynnema sp. L-07 TaxID=1653480 RepID=UPI00065F066E|nr:lantibiotic dehydratase [Alloactinosynnema sp. L-07]CRK59225.1 Lanthionine biosynthesis protein LanB [Alloactinosynnema sp. L-07]